MFYRQSVLPNGIRILTEELPSVRSIALGLWFRVGSRDEEAATSGISHFMEHMIFKGTDTRSAVDISTEFESLGAEYNAFTSKEYTCFYARFVDDKLPRVLDILADITCHPAFRQEDIDSEREVVLEEIARSEDSPDDYVFDLFTQALIPDHSMGWRVLGDAERVASFMHQDFVDYHSQHYCGENLVVSAAGNLDHDTLVALCEKVFANVPAGEPVKRSECIATGGEHHRFLQKDTEQAHIVYGMPSLSAKDPDRFALQLLSCALGGGMSSRLFLEIREKRGLAYAVQCDCANCTDVGSFLIYTGTRPANVATVLEIFQNEMEKLREGGLTQEELDRNRDFITGQLLLGMEGTRARMNRLGRTAVMGNPLRSIDEVLQEYNAVSLEDIDRVIARLLDTPSTLTIISPYSDEELESMSEELR